MSATIYVPFCKILFFKQLRNSNNSKKQLIKYFFEISEDHDFNTMHLAYNGFCFFFNQYTFYIMHPVTPLQITQ